MTRLDKEACSGHPMPFFNEMTQKSPQKGHKIDLKKKISEKKKN